MAVCLPHQAGTVALIRSATRNMLTLFGVTEDCVEDIGLALSEACTNVIAHASTDDEYEVQVGVDDRQCLINLRNASNDFDAAKKIGMIPDPHSATGRGVAIMHALMGPRRFHLRPQVGTIVRLVRACARRRPDSPPRITASNDLARTPALSTWPTPSISGTPSGHMVVGLLLRTSTEPHNQKG